MTELETAESNLLHKLMDDLKAGVPELGTVSYESTELAASPLGSKGHVFKLRIHALTTERFELEGKLFDSGAKQVCSIGWIKTEDSVTKILGLVKALVAKYLA